jgi:hypothetical protein
MKRVALGIRMHSGWGILVAVNDEADVIDRRRIVVTHAEGFRGKQPFHQAEALGLERAESFLEHYSADCHALARAQISDAVANYGARGYSVATAAILLASGRICRLCVRSLLLMRSSTLLKANCSVESLVALASHWAFL